ncbi:alpha/beta hydrolase family protein [Paenibacillus radicis (ex Gao et al. 2016)]|uniref:Carboxylic ester hydrolase n=1 Tax=Paenibacillus radicis (ex Gao et al. 2016) TaxID=1737354 RepID=A0A917H1T0_9BACL|nr:acetylhydrolase [Paenibacillus radicis (ex Gao et al. 2016)]GGG64817.1 carboxylic ester hydrolase [Paenibacillus radicis (ex Gao et al. 2016)]
MRSLEILFIVINILLTGWLIFAKNKPQRFLLIGFGVSAIFMLIHGVIEGMRLPMIPAYVLTALPLILFVVRSIPKSGKAEERTARKGSKLKLIAITALAVIYSAVTVALPILIPVFTFNKPAGPYKIGTVAYDWKDNSRDEILTSDPDDKRELMVQIWYPADAKAKGKKQAYHTNVDAFAEGYSKMFSFPKLLFTSLGYVKTHAIEKAEISNAEPSFPVLIFSHGLTGNKMQNTFQLEQLVSQGYIVVGIDHTYSSTASVFPDGRVAALQLPEIKKFSDLDKANEQWVEDAKFVLDQVEQLAANDPEKRFTGRMDMNNVGMFGHSFGGATSVQVLMTDSRIKAAINMDGALYGELRIPEDGLKKPFMMMSADSSVENLKTPTGNELDMSKEIWPRFAHITTGGSYWLILNKTNHLSFTDMVLFSPLFQLMQGSNIREALGLINDYSLDFFDHYLKNKPTRLLEQNIGEHPEFTLQRG